MGKRGFEEDDRKARTRVKGDGGKRRSERGRLRTRVATSPGATAGDSFYRLQFAAPKRHRDLKHELFPLHSPLLGESLLVSFPPLNNMLKFRGFSYFI